MLHQDPRAWAAVGVGGALGTAAREGLVLAVPWTGELPVVILAINVVGAFVLGAVLEALVRSGPDVGRRRAARLTVGTGFCGGFTTYSTLATGTALLLGHGHVATAVLYGVLTLGLGALATIGGIAWGAALGRRPAAPAAGS